MTLFLPFILIFLNGEYKNIVVASQPEPSMEVCLDNTRKQLTSILENLPEGVTIKGGCLPIPTPIDLSKPGDKL